VTFKDRHGGIKFTPRIGCVKDGRNKSITEREEIKDKWRSYTEELYKKDTNHDIHRNRL